MLTQKKLTKIASGLPSQKSLRRIAGMAIPYSVFGVRLVGQPPMLEVIERGAFAEAVTSGRSLRTGKPIFACWGHRRAGRKRSDWRIADTAIGNLRLWEENDGVYFEIVGVRLPLDFTGVSVRLEPIRRVRESVMARRIVVAGIAHIALLRAPESPCYEQTFLRTIQLSG